MIDAIVVGAGLFGATVARKLRSMGLSVTIFDDRRLLSGSAASGSLMKPSWFDGLGRAVYEPALATLHELYRVRELDFTVPPGLHTKVLWVPTAEILDIDFVRGKVLDVRPGLVRVDLTLVDSAPLGTTFEAPLIVVAAGHWCRELLPSLPPIEGKMGVSFRWRDATTENRINPWAPYKQMVRFNEGTGVWAGDGTAIKPENWTLERGLVSENRVRKFVGLEQPPLAVVGIRPYCPDAKPCKVVEVHPGLWVATGGAKNGLVGAGWAAHEIGRSL